jgi:hypothetical protein
MEWRVPIGRIKDKPKVRNVIEIEEITTTWKMKDT